MSEIDWSKAPEGSTHFYKCGNMFLKVDGDGMVSYLRTDGVWEHNRCHVDSYGGYLTPRPSAWSGDGLPPVGTVCEFMCTARDSARDWGSCLVKYASEFTVVLDDYSSKSGRLDGEFVAHPITLKFRPIRTPEQIAAEEREKAVTDICLEVEGLVSRFNVSIDTSAAMRAVVEAMYDSGYRKVEP